MSLASVAVLLLTLADPNTAPDPCGPHASATRDGARTLYGEGNYIEAARRYHSLWTCGGQSRDLLNAVQSYLLAESLAEAIDLWNTAIAAGARIEPTQREKGEAFVAAAVSHTTPIVVELTTEGRNPPATAELTVCRLNSAGVTLAPCSIRRTIAVARLGTTVALQLDRGAWQLRVRWADQPEPTRADLRVAHDRQIERFTWRATRPPRRLAAGLLALGSTTAAAGLGIGLVGWQYNVTETEANGNFTGIEGLPLRTIGAAIGGAGLALVGSGAASALIAPPRLRRFGGASLAFGLALAGAGAGLLADAARRLDGFAPDPASEARCDQSSQCLAGQQLAGALAVGLGGGLLVGGIAGLVADPPARRPARWSVAPELSRTTAGLRLRLAF